MKNSEKHQVGTSLLLLGMGMLMGEENVSDILNAQESKSPSKQKKKSKRESAGEGNNEK